MLDEETCYRAVESRDARFEGRFLLAVTSTGVYCRVGCPARTPKRANTRFFPSAAAAEEAGFRACLRCRPDRVVDLVGTTATVRRALRLLGEDPSLPALAERLGIGDRHLRRLFALHLGTSPAALVRSQRLHLARKLLEETDLPLAQVALSAGFGSLRRFNDAVRAGFHRTPSQLRGAARVSVRDLIELRLPYKAPYDWEGILAFLRPRAIPGVEEVGGTWRRKLPAGTIEVAHGEGALLLRLPAALAGRELLGIVARVKDLFDLRADPLAIGEHLSRDPLLAPLVARRPGLRVPGAWDPFELAVRAVLGQQVSVAGATTLAGRLVRDHGGGSFPSPAAMALLPEEGAGMPRARVRALRALAEAALAGRDLAVPDVLLGLPGIGPWTASYVAMRAGGDPDAFPASDLGLRKAVARGRDLPGQKELEALAEPWRPWRSYAALHLWTSLGDEPC